MKTSVVSKSRVVNIPDVYKDERFLNWDLYGVQPKFAHVAIVDRDDPTKVLGVIEMINKEGEKSGEYTNFSKNDEKLVKMLCSHAAIFLKNSQ